MIWEFAGEEELLDVSEWLEEADEEDVEDPCLEEDDIELDLLASPWVDCHASAESGAEVSFDEIFC